MQVGRVSVVGPLSGVVNVIDDACEIKRMLMLMLLLHSDSIKLSTVESHYGRALSKTSGEPLKQPEKKGLSDLVKRS